MIQHTRTAAPAGPPTRRGNLLPAFLPLAVLVACAPADDGRGGEPAAGVPATTTGTAHDEFWDNLARQCGQAFAGRLVEEPPGDDMLTGDEELIAHWAACEESDLHIAFHIETDDGAAWDRSRTWILMRRDDGIELRHDHRRPDGTDDDVTWYGAHTAADGTATAQEFILEERRADDGSRLGWRIEIVPGERYTYGTIRGDAYTWRVDFDLSTPVPTPPPAWGHE